MALLTAIVAVSLAGEGRVAAGGAGG
jgi:hypothetical protein